MNSNKDTETQIHVFSPKEILSKKKNKNRNNTDFGKVARKTCSESFCDESPYRKSVRKLWNEFRGKIFNGALVAVVGIVICLAVNQLNWSLGYEVYVDGENIGFVTDKETVFNAIDEARLDVKMYLGDDAVYEKEPVFVRRLVSEDKLASKDVIKETLLSNVDTLVEGYAVYIDGKSVFGVSNMEAADWVLAQYKQNAVGEITDDMVVEFCETIEVRKEYMGIGMLETPENALAVLSGTDKQPDTYIVQENDTIWEIADKFDISVESILAMNEGVSDDIHVGEELQIEKAVPLLSVRCIQTVASTEPVPYPIEKIDDASLYEGRSVVAQEGIDGKQSVLAMVTTVNGVQVDKQVISSSPITEPVAQIEKVGTMERPATTGSGSFDKPSAGTLSSRYGMRWDRNHDGIDIVGEYNSNIMAADGGIVTYADWMDGYGNYVIIDHENGYQTAYGHCASLEVSVGDRVAKGDVIAKMGNTGRSTGTHLHFEVKKNGEFVNPLEYVGY